MRQRQSSRNLTLMLQPSANVYSENFCKIRSKFSRSFVYDELKLLISYANLFCFALTQFGIA